MKLCNLTWQEAIRAGKILHTRWIGSGPVDLARVQTVIRREIAETKKRPARMTAGCLRECRNDLKQAGSIRQHHPDLFKGDTYANA